MNRFQVLTQAITFFGILSVTMLLNTIFLSPKKKVVERKQVAALIGSMLGYFYLDVYLNQLGPVPLKSLITFLLLIVYLAISLLFFRGSFLQKVFVILLQLLFTFVVQNILSVIFYLTIGVSGVKQLIEKGFDLDILTTISLFGLFFLMKKIGVSKLYSLPKKMVVLQSAVISSCLLTNLAILLSDKSYFSHLFVAILLVLCIYLKTTEKYQRMIRKNQLEEQKYLQLEKYYQELELYHESIQLLKHDRKNQLVALQGYIGQGAYSEAQDQLNILWAEYEKVTLGTKINEPMEEQTE